MGYSSYSDIRSILESDNLEDFEGNSVRGMWVDNRTRYVVLSYATIILECNRHGEPVYFDNHRYSQTTSRLQGMLREVFPSLRRCIDRGVYVTRPGEIL